MRVSSITKNAGKACNNRLYRHIRTFEKIVKNYFVISNKYTNKESQNKKNITDVEQELLSAKKLLDNGIISSEEFNTIKKKLLDQVM